MKQYEREKLYLSKEVIEDLFTKQILTRSYEEKGAYLLDGDKLIVHLKEEQFKLTITPAKAVKPEGVGKWINEYRELFPKGKNPNTDKLFKGDKPMCLKNMTKFMKDYDYTKEEILEVTQEAIGKARNENWLYFPMAHYFIHKQNIGSMLAQLLEYKKNGGEDEERRNIGI